MAHTSSTIWKINKILAGVVVFVLLMSALLGGVFFAYKKAQPTVNKEAYEKSCSTKQKGCGRYGFDQECNIAGGYDTTYERKVYTTPNQDIYGSFMEPGKVRWFCSSDEAKTAGYNDPYDR